MTSKNSTHLSDNQKDAASIDAASSVIHLRPHHLLCLQTFIGHGYSEDFIIQMKYVKRKICQESGATIRLVTGADDLCRHCPNCINGSCTSDKPALFDRLTLEKLSLTQDPLIQLRGIPQILQISESILHECCPGCEWKKLCRTVICDVSKSC